MRRRRFLAAGCRHCALIGAAFGAPAALAQATIPPDWRMPGRFDRPDIATDEGGLWAIMDREERKLRRSPFLMRDASLQAYLQNIACKLAGNHCPDVRVYPVRAPFFNASMAPNGMTQVWSGLLLRVDNEAQLAAVIGHEIGHYVQRHVTERLRDAKSRSAFGMFLGMFGVVGLIGQLATVASAFGFSRDQERQADVIGLKLMRDAGYDPREASKVWENLQAEAAASAEGDPTKSSPMFATHPPSDERRDALRLAAASSRGGFVGEAEYAGHLASFIPDLLDDELKRGRPGETLVLLDRLIARQPQRPDFIYYRGEARRIREGSGDLAAARADFEAAIALGNEPPATHRGLGYIALKENRGADARAAFARYLQQAPEAPDALLIKSYLNDNRP